MPTKSGGPVLAAARLFVICLVLCPCVGKAAGSTIFGPNTYVMQPGKPDTFGESIPLETSAFCNGRAEFVLVVENSGIASANIWLNGAAILSELHFSANKKIIERPISLEPAANAMSIQLKGGKRGSLLTVSIRREVEPPCGVALTITSPAEGAIIDSRRVLVHGTVAGPPDVGIAVDGVIADIDLTHSGAGDDPFPWFATVPAEQGTVTITATASTSNEPSTTVRRTVVLATGTEWVEIEPLESSGPAPLETTFRLRTEIEEEIALYEADLDGDGIYESRSAVQPDRLQTAYSSPGTRVVSARVTTLSGRIFRGSAAVVVQSFSTTHEILQKLWGDFRAALASGSIDAALPFLAGDQARNRYKPRLELIRPTLSRYASGLTTIEPISISGRTARYLLSRSENGTMRGYHVYFVRDVRGVWRIAQF